MSRIIAIANQKGGTGKTTTAINLAAGLARAGRGRVLFIDIDPHANATSVFLGAMFIAQPEPGLTIYEVIKGSVPAAQAIRPHSLEANGAAITLDILPSHSNLAVAEMELVATFQRENRLRTALTPIVNHYRYIIIDCPPNLGLLTINALMAATEILIPVEPGYFPLIGLGLLRKTIETITAANPALRVMGVVPVRVNRTNLANSTVQELSAAFGALLLPAIPERTAIGEAHAQGKDIFQHAGSSDSAVAFNLLIEEIINRDQAN